MSTGAVVIDYDQAALGPTIRIAVNTITELDRLRSIVRSLANGNGPVDLGQIDGFELRGLQRFTLQVTSSNTAKSLSVDRLGHANWFGAPHQWRRRADLLEGLSQFGGSAHQYLSEENVDDALVVVAFREESFVDAVDDFETAFNALRQAAAAGDCDAAELIIFGPIDDVAMEQEPWTDELFAAVSRLLEDQAFLRLQSSWHLTTIIDRYWDNLTPRQRDQIREPLASSFDAFCDWMGAYVVAGILGGRYVDDRTLDVLDALSRRVSSPNRELAVYGLGTLARAAGAGVLYDRALERLRELTTDGAEAVRAEATSALRTLAGSG